MLTHSKSGTVQPERVVEVIAVSHTVEVGGSLQVLGRLGMVLRGLLVSTGVLAGTVEAKGYEYYKNY
ncbi:hypothetical protein DDQ68_18835 [Hymenobacter nivis]|uniref:Uncharacterized protein n=1 Tax=Hymenobacter nivis TaxID=1850093 RepID=A0A2Z3GRB7_9BACT|nr:hypothetical protein DDQ68_18835 [Hymenobacter nivis]